MNQQQREQTIGTRAAIIQAMAGMLPKDDRSFDQQIETLRDLTMGILASPNPQELANYGYDVGTLLPRLESLANELFYALVRIHGNTPTYVRAKVEEAMIRATGSGVSHG